MIPVAQPSIATRSNVGEAVCGPKLSVLIDTPTPPVEAMRRSRSAGLTGFQLEWTSIPLPALRSVRPSADVSESSGYDCPPTVELNESRVPGVWESYGSPLAPSEWKTILGIAILRSQAKRGN